MNDNIFIRRHVREDGARSYSVHYVFDCVGRDDDPPVLCELPTLEQAASLARYINGGNMSRAEREAVHVALSVELERFRKAHRANGGVTH